MGIIVLAILSQPTLFMQVFRKLTLKIQATDCMMNAGYRLHLLNQRLEISYANPKLQWRTVLLLFFFGSFVARLLRR